MVTPMGKIGAITGAGYGGNLGIDSPDFQLEETPGFGDLYGQTYDLMGGPDQLGDYSAIAPTIEPALLAALEEAKASGLGPEFFSGVGQRRSAEFLEEIYGEGKMADQMKSKLAAEGAIGSPIAGKRWRLDVEAPTAKGLAGIQTKLGEEEMQHQSEFQKYITDKTIQVQGMLADIKGMDASNEMERSIAQANINQSYNDMVSRISMAEAGQMTERATAQLNADIASWNATIQLAQLEMDYENQQMTKDQYEFEKKKWGEQYALMQNEFYLEYATAEGLSSSEEEYLSGSFGGGVSGTGYGGGSGGGSGGQVYQAKKGYGSGIGPGPLSGNLENVYPGIQEGDTIKSGDREYRVGRDSSGLYTYEV